MTRVDQFEGAWRFIHEKKGYRPAEPTYNFYL